MSKNVKILIGVVVAVALVVGGVFYFSNSVNFKGLLYRGANVQKGKMISSKNDCGIGKWKPIFEYNYENEEVVYGGFSSLESAFNGGCDFKIVMMEHSNAEEKLGYIVPCARVGISSPQRDFSCYTSIILDVEGGLILDDDSFRDGGSFFAGTPGSLAQLQQESVHMSFLEDRVLEKEYFNLYLKGFSSNGGALFYNLTSEFGEGVFTVFARR